MVGTDPISAAGNRVPWSESARLWATLFCVSSVYRTPATGSLISIPAGRSVRVRPAESLYM